MHEYVFLRGNHEDMMMHDNYTWYMNGADTTVQSYKNNGIDYIDVIHGDFFKSTEIYHQHGNYVFVHACMYPGFTLKAQDYETMLWSRNYDNYDGEYKDKYFLVRGHTPQKNIVKLSHQLNIDTGCVFGYIDKKYYDAGYNKLTAVCLPENPEDEYGFEFLFADARG